MMMHTKMRRAAFYCATTALGLTMGVGGAAAAEATAPEASAATTLPEVVVTAERRTQNLQTVPISATVLTGEQLARQGVNRVGDLQQVSPSLAINTVGRSIVINIRGVGLAATAPTSSPGVAVYLNGVLVPHEFTIGGSFYDIDAVEVLRGPQGTLSGQNSTGGAVYFRTPQPRFNEFSGSYDQTLGNYNWRREVLAVNVPLIEDKVALRVAGVRDQRDSFTKNIGGSAQPGDLNYTGFRADLRLKPFDRLEADLRYEYILSDAHYNAVKNRTDKVTTDPYTIEEDAASIGYVEGTRYDAEIKYDLTDSVRVRYAASSQLSEITDTSDGDRTATALARPFPNTVPASTNPGRLAYTHTEVKTVTHEINVLSTGDGDFQWVVGAFYMRDKLPVRLYTYNNDTVSRLHAPTSITDLITQNTSQSIFGQATYRFNPHWQVVVGGRYSRNTQDFVKLAGVPGLPAGGITESTSSKVPTGRAALNYNLTDNTLIYASVARGYKAGGVNLVLGDTPYRPEINVVEELGFKTTILDHHLRLNGDIYASQYKDLQLQTLTPARSPSTQNVGKSKVFGAELEGQAVFGYFHLNFGASYLDPKTDVAASLLDGTISPSVLKVVPSGSRLPYSPKISLNAGVEYDFHLGGDQVLTPRLQWSHTDKSYASIFQSVNSLMGARDILDARLTWAPNTRLIVEAFATNLTDRTYIASQFFGSSSADGGILYGPRRQVGVRAKYNFGAR